MRTISLLQILFCTVLLASSPIAPIACNGQENKESQTRESGEWKKVADIQGLPTRIAFGSCGHHAKPQPILNTIVEAKPDLFIYLGDNIYGDTKDMKVLQRKYDQLAAKKEFNNLRENMPVLSVWDDHDYGWNDAGKEYELKEQSKEIFMDFWKVPQDSPRRSRAGIYGSHRFTDSGRTLQVILLDTRTFRDSLKRIPDKVPEGSPLKNAYQPDDDDSKTLLGEAQWKWLHQKLKETADVRIICSSIQFGHEYNGWESWTNLPVEQQKLIDMIKDTQANGVLFISGDVHWGEFSKREYDGQYPIYDITASGLTEEWYNVEPNKFRIGEAVRANHFGVIELDWRQATGSKLPLPKARFQIRTTDGAVAQQHEVDVANLTFK